VSEEKVTETSSEGSGQAVHDQDLALWAFVQSLVRNVSHETAESTSPPSISFYLDVVLAVLMSLTLLSVLTWTVFVREAMALYLALFLVCILLRIAFTLWERSPYSRRKKKLARSLELSIQEIYSYLRIYRMSQVERLDAERILEELKRYQDLLRVVENNNELMQQLLALFSGSEPLQTKDDK
jgi:hypothetical protein